MPEWIPCSERMPKVGDLVMVTVLVVTDAAEVYRCVRLDVAAPSGGWQSCWNTVLAWRPLPAPWEGGR